MMFFVFDLKHKCQKETKMKPNYNKLTIFLENGADKIGLSFRQIEIIIGAELPPVYTSRRTIGQKSSRIRMAAEQAGFCLKEVDYDNCWVLFCLPSVEMIDGQEHEKVDDESVIASDDRDIGKDLDESIRYFKSHWSSVGGEYVPFCDKYSDIDDVYFNAGMEAYRAAMKRAIKFYGLDQRTRNELRNESCRYLADRFRVLFAIQHLTGASYDDWGKETTEHIRSIYRDRNVIDYTIGNAQKIINVALKFVMSSNLVDYHSDVFKYCHFPVDGRIQQIIKQQLGVGYLNQNRVEQTVYSSWSNNDNWSDFIDYQNRVRVAVADNGYYSPMVWEATHWR